MKFYLIDDHKLILSYLQRLLSTAYPHAEINEYTSGNDFLLQASVGTQEDSLVICDILMPTISGIDLTDDIKAKFPAIKILIMTSLIDTAMVKLLLKKGVDGYITKDCDEEELLKGIHAVLQGEKYINNSLKDKIVKQVFDEEIVEYELSKREKQVLQLICEGKMPKEIAADIEISLNTVQQYIKNIMRKFRVNRTTELVVFAIQKGLYSPRPQ
jgi:DNA-binding NarL/FixJ family response regulator